MSHLVVVTGATGNVGGGLAERLLSSGVAVRAIARSGGKLAPLAERGAEAAAGSIEDAAFLASVFQGADAVFAMLPPNYAAQDARGYQRNVVGALRKALQEAKVPRVVSRSSIGADKPSGNGPIAGLHELEQEVHSLDLFAIHVRGAYFM